MGDCGSGVAIDFDKEEAGGIVELLKNVEALNPRLLQTCAGVCQRGVLESVKGLGSDVDVNMNNEHVGCERFQSARSGAVIAGFVETANCQLLIEHSRRYDPRSSKFLSVKPQLAAKKR